MCSKSFVKRIVPFFLTFAVGLFVASFFVSIAAPNFQFNRGFRRHQQYHQQMEFENQQLREKVSRLEKQAADKDFEGVQNLNYQPPMPPPPAPRALYRR